MSNRRRAALRWLIRCKCEQHGVEVSSHTVRQAVQVSEDAMRERDWAGFFAALADFMERVLPLILRLLLTGRKPDSIDGIGIWTKASGQHPEETKRHWEDLK